MRPLMLAFTGVRSYPGPGPVTVDFTGKNLIAILGDTGAGKTTILEAITYALFGKGSWAETRPLVAEGASAMSVDLTFSHDDQRWRVRRSFHTNTTPSSHLLENLETRERIDGAGAVDAKIRSLLGLTYETYQTVVLLPQGRFDRLLTATGSERTRLLKELFGAHDLETAQGLTRRRLDALKDLLHRAELARGQLLPSPAAAAREAESTAERAEREADELSAALDTLQTLQNDAVRARDRGSALDAALSELKSNTVTDYQRTLDALVPLHADTAHRAVQIAMQLHDANQQVTALRGQLAQAERDGLTERALATAENFLTGVPGQLARIGEEEDRLAAEQAGLEDERKFIDTEHTRIEQTRGELQSAAAAAQQLTDRQRSARESLSLLREAVGAALSAADATARARREELAAGQVRAGFAATLPARHSAVDSAQRGLSVAQERLADVHRNDAAATAAEHLAAGDLCPVCTRALPGDFHPPTPSDQKALRAAQRAEKTASTALREAEAAANQLIAREQEAAKAVTARQAAVRQSRTQLEEAIAAAARAYAATSGALAALHDAPAADRTAFTADLRAAADTLADRAADAPDIDRPAFTKTLLESAYRAESDLTAGVLAAQNQAQSLEAQTDASATALDKQRSALRSAVAKHSAAVKRHVQDHATFTTSVRSLPGAVRACLPEDARRTTADDSVRALALVQQRSADLLDLRRRHDHARDQVEQLTAQQGELTREHDTQVVRPLRALLGRLGQWAGSAQRSAVVLEPARRIPVPEAPDEPTPDTAGPYADCVARVAADVRTALDQQAGAARDVVDRLTCDLAEQCRALRERADGLDPDGDLLAPAALHPLVAARQSALDTATRARAEQLRAHSQITQAATLDHALEAGDTRQRALVVLHRELGDGGFLRYLISQRTHALLGVASDLFSQLSDGQFGFAADFKIVNRSTGAERGPKTLSGGETFLASLALALALVELYSRSGPRLGALFLDEGFGSLDTDTLDTALTVLRGEAGGDRLVVVISHLHAVAEAVDDALWVKRTPSGSTARWLTSQERDALIYQETDAGLLSLT